MSNNLPADWSFKSIDDVASIFAGGTPSRNKPEYYDGNIPWVKSGEVNARQIFDTSEHISMLAVKESSARMAPSGSVLLAMYGATAGQVAKLMVDATLNQAVSAINAKNNLADNDYLIYILEHNTGELLNRAQGSGQPNLSGQLIKGLKIPLPPLPEQQKIAAILTSVDEVIEKTAAQIAKLKDLKTAMMQELLTRGVGIDGKPHTEFKDSPVGRIPKGWEVLPLSQVAKLERGKFSHRPRNDPSFYNGSIPFLQTGDIPKKSPYIKKFSQTLNERGLGVSKLFPIGTLVITIAATIGEIGILEFDSCFPDSLVGIKVNSKKADSMYVLYVMRHLKSNLDLLAPQTAQKNINLDILNPFIIPVPPLLEQVQISKILETIDSRLNLLDRKLTMIQNTKKALMQDLLTGKVRVKVAS